MRRLLLAVLLLFRLSGDDLHSIEARIAALPLPLQVITKIDWSQRPGLPAAEVLRLREEAFDAGLSAKERCHVLPELLGLIAAQDLRVARQLLVRVPNDEDHQRRQMIDQLVERALDGGHVDEAEALLASLPVDGEFPMDSVFMLVHELPDERRPAWFARALEADQQGAPHYWQFFAKYQREMPQEQRRAGASAIFAELARGEKELERYGGVRMEVEFAGGHVAMRWFDLKALEIWDALREASPEEAEAFLESHGELRDFLRDHPDGLPPTATRTRPGKGGADSAFLDRLRKDEVLGRQAWAAAKNDLAAADAFVQQIVDEATRIEVRLRLWKQYPAMPVVFETESTVRALRNAPSTMVEFAAFLDAQGRTADRDRVLRAVASRVDALLAEESAGENANGSWRGTWPSTQVARELGFAMGHMMTAAEVDEFLRLSMKSAELRTVAVVAAMVSRSGVEALGMRMTTG